MMYPYKGSRRRRHGYRCPHTQLPITATPNVVRVSAAAARNATSPVDSVRYALKGSHTGSILKVPLRTLAISSAFAQKSRPMQGPLRLKLPNSFLRLSSLSSESRAPHSRVWRSSLWPKAHLGICPDQPKPASL